MYRVRACPFICYHFQQVFHFWSFDLNQFLIDCYIGKFLCFQLKCFFSIEKGVIVYLVTVYFTVQNYHGLSYCIMTKIIEIFLQHSLCQRTSRIFELLVLKTTWITYNFLQALKLRFSVFFWNFWTHSATTFWWECPPTYPIKIDMYRGFSYRSCLKQQQHMNDVFCIQTVLRPLYMSPVDQAGLVTGMNFALGS